MNWEAISEISQTASGIAVVISLLYLAFQIRFARLAASDTSRTARSIGVREIDLTMVNSLELRENWLKSSDLTPVYEKLGSQLNLSIEEALQVDTLCQCWMRLHWGQHKSITAEEDLKDLERMVSVFYSASPMLHCWRIGPYGKNVFDADFVQFVNNAISKRSS